MTESATQEVIEVKKNGQAWKMRVLMLGTVMGALAGLGTAFLLTQRAEKSGKPLSISTGQGVKLGTMLVGLIQQVLHLGDEGAKPR